MKTKLFLVLVALICCIAGNILAENGTTMITLTDTATSDPHFFLNIPTPQIGGPTCTTDPPDMTVPASSEGECLGIAQAHCGYRIASLCYYEGTQTCSFACIGNY